MKKLASWSGYASNPNIKDFIDEVETVCRKHGMSISHEDGHGAFTIEKLNEHNIDWLKDAFDNT